MVTEVANVSWHLLDRAVIEGRADEVLLEVDGRPWSHARVLEEVAALGGVLRHLGVAEGVGVRLDLAPEHALEAVLTALATARLGGTVMSVGPTGPAESDAAPVVVCSAGSEVEAGGDVPRLVRGEGVTEPDLDWAVMLRAGRTDPAPVAALTAGAAYAPGRTVGEQVALLREHLPPYDAAQLRALLTVEPAL